MLRLLQRPLPAVMGADVKPEQVFAHTLLAVRGLAKLSSYLYKVLAPSGPPCSPSTPPCLVSLAHDDDTVQRPAAVRRSEAVCVCVCVCVR